MFKTLASRMFTTPEEPKYKVIDPPEGSKERDRGFEEREYEPCMWAVVDATGDTAKEATTAGFRQLLKYISGTNKEGATVPMSAPVMVFHQPGEDESWKSFKKEVKVGFMISTDKRENPPTPNDDTPITFRKTPTTRVYVRKYGGFSKEEIALAEVANLRDALGTKHKYMNSFCYFCGYDSPMTMFGRRNEIWFLKETSEAEI
ncbi:heme-binding protein 1-like [Patiria miniata]|uniref:Heme-binding protein 1 n=1 Tax=Patiria miniata TaxID=46514 RepID=A0A913ZEV0_PATMI|nr:heme-binding protein 1-like [Patiria miniata]